ncbi:GRF-type domain-containing protein [Heracleum sosnowskyi]|uniref:GRF-type domain-containing protein n=1 Tax=Heracleum sosnowskyi TaxID=360622 RepID=A0AAD8I4W2_9APIA|nr:GRF-type domain-containing protein [Heracleum sosnowskyi]
MSQQCFCRNWAVEKTSWTDANTGWRFLTCANGNCNFFRWAEAEFDDRSKGVINRIKRRIGKKDDDHIMELVNARKEYNEQDKPTSSFGAFFRFINRSIFFGPQKLWHLLASRSELGFIVLGLAAEK